MTPAALAVVLAGLAPAAELQVKPTDWPQYRGPHRDGVSSETGLLKKWPANGPSKLWTAAGLGGGYSTVSVVGGMVFGTGKVGGKEQVYALAEATGKPLWATPIADARRVGYDDGPRSTPTYADGKVYAVSMGGTLACLDARTGKPVWSKSYTDDFGGSVQSWGYSESVLVDDGKVIATPCSKSAAVVALDAKTGATVWTATVQNPGGAGGYSSAVKTTVGGVPMYVTLLGKDGGVVGVHAKTGRVLWQYTKMMNGTANIPSPVVKDDLVFASTGYGAGAALLKLTETGGAISVDEVKFYKGGELQNHHGGMVLVGDHVYLGSQHNSGFPACVDVKTGDIAWKESKPIAGGSGSSAVAAADGMIYFRYENGLMALVKADPTELQVVSTFKLPTPSGKPSWPHPTIANGRLFIRDQDKLHCFNVKAGR